jgi:hypothetical protein
MEDELQILHEEFTVNDAACIGMDVKQSSSFHFIGPAPGPQMPKKRRHIYPLE